MPVTLNGPWVHYDNVTDPYQMHNLVGDPTVDSLQAALETELQAWMERLDDPLEGAGRHYWTGTV